MKLYRLFSVLVLAAAGPMLTAQSAATAKPAAPVTQAAAAKPSRGTLLDINTATPDQLKQLPGVGDAFAKRIVDGRPYTAKNQLLSRGILPKATYEGISDGIIAKRVAK
jgi:competence protein ComEA